RLEANDGSEAFKRDATWCSKPGNFDGSDVSLESKAQPGRFLRHVNGQVWAANNSGANWFDVDRLYKEDSTWKVVDPDPDVTTPIMNRWYNDDAFRVAAGNPTATEVYDGGVRYRDFAGGRVYWRASGAYTGPFLMTGETVAKYKSVGEYKAMFPIGDTFG